MTILQTERPSDGSGRLARLLFPALLVTSQLLVFGPYTIYRGNPGEFVLPFSSVVGVLLLALIVALAVLVGVGWLCPRRWEPTYVAIVFGLGLAVWVQGNVMLGGYGLLEAERIDWSRHLRRGVLDVGVWVAVLAGTVVFAGRVSRVAQPVSKFLVALLTVLAVITLARPQPGLEGPPAQQVAPPAGLYELSETQNVIHLVLDAFQSDVFREILEADRERFDRELDGFVFFADHAGVYPTTSFSIPAMLTGQRYGNDVPAPEFLREAFERGSIINGLARVGYEIDVVSILRRTWTDDWLIPARLADGSLSDEPATNYYQLSRSFANESVHRRFLAAFLVDLSLFRHTPQLLKRWVYNDQAWRLRSRYAPRLGFAASSAKSFLEDLTAQLRVSRRAPVYKLLHLGIPHRPIVFDAECRFIDFTRASRDAFREQARCAMRLVVDLLDGLRRTGVYDDSLVVVSSDHGAAFVPPGALQADDPAADPDGPELGERVSIGGNRLTMPRIMGGALALLLVKPPGSRGPVTVSTAPTSIVDIPATVFDALGLAHEFDGESAFGVKDTVPRSRLYSVYDMLDDRFPERFFERMDVFSIDGAALDVGSWSYGGTVFSADYELPAEVIDMGTRAARRHLGRGWGTDRAEVQDGATYLRALGDTATVYVSLPSSAVELTAVLRSPASTERRRIEVDVDGRPVDSWELVAGRGSQRLTLPIPADMARPRISAITFRRARDGADSPPAVRFYRIELSAS